MATKSTNPGKVVVAKSNPQQTINPNQNAVSGSNTQPPQADPTKHGPKHPQMMKRRAEP